MNIEGAVIAVLWCAVGASAVTYCELCYWCCRREAASWAQLAADVLFWPATVAGCWARHGTRPACEAHSAAAHL